MNKEKELYNKIKIIKNKPIVKNISTTEDTSGRFANHFIRNMAAHILSKKYNLKFIYSYYNEIKELGIDLFIDGVN